EPCGTPQGRGGVELAAIRLRVRTSYRLQLLISGCIYEVTSPRYALRCFATHVETRSPPNEESSLYLNPKSRADSAVATIDLVAGVDGFASLFHAIVALLR